jgi:hypothetical protein
MKFGVRMPSFKKRLAARMSFARYVRHTLGFKAPRGWGWLTNPKRALYNRIYSRTTVSVDRLLKGGRRSKGGIGAGSIVLIILGAAYLGSTSKKTGESSALPTPTASEIKVTPLAEVSKPITVAASSCYMRMAPAVSSARVGVLSPGRKLVVLEIQGNWRRVETEGTKGWIHLKCLREL